MKKPAIADLPLAHEVGPGVLSRLVAEDGTLVAVGYGFGPAMPQDFDPAPIGDEIWRLLRPNPA